MFFPPREQHEKCGHLLDPTWGHLSKTKAEKVHVAEFISLKAFAVTHHPL